MNPDAHQRALEYHRRWWIDLGAETRARLRAADGKPAKFLDWDDYPADPDGTPLAPPEAIDCTFILPMTPDELDQLAGIDPREDTNP